MRDALEFLFVRFLERGESDALDEVFQRCSPPLLGHAERLGHRGSDADDLVQETLVTAIERGADYSVGRPLLPWLKGILARKAAQHARAEARQYRHRQRLASPTPGDGRGPLSKVEEAELRRLLERALASLPERYRRPLELHLIDGLDPIEVATTLAEPRSTVRVHLYRGMRMLREVLPSGVTLTAVAALLGSSVAARTKGPVGDVGGALEPASDPAPHLAPDSAAGSPVTQGESIPVPMPRRAWRWALPTGLGLATLGALWFGWIRPEDSPAPIVVPTAHEIVDRQIEGGHESELRSTPPPRVASPASPPPSSSPMLLVRVVDDHGDPVPAVGLRASPAVGRDPVLHRRRAVSDAAGIARFAMELGTVRVDTDRGGGAMIEHRATNQTHRIAVPPASTVRGRAVGPFGRPVGGAEIWLNDIPGDPGAGTVVTRTDPAGWFELRHVAVGSLLGALGAELAPARLVEVRPDAGVLELPMIAGSAMRGRVVDADGRAVVDALVTVGRSLDSAPMWLAQGARTRRQPPHETRTNRHGEFVLRGIPRGRHPVFVRASGFAPLAAYHRAEEEPLRLVMRSGRSLLGSVWNRDGVGIAHAVVAFRSQSSSWHVDLTTDADGHFVCDAAPADAVRVAAKAPGYLPASERLGADRLAVDLVLDRLRRVRGRVRAESRSVAGWQIEARYRPRTSLEAGRAHALVGEDSTFSVLVPAGVRPRWFVRSTDRGLWFDVSSVATWDGDEVELVLPSASLASAQVRGRVTDATGAALVGARLRLASVRSVAGGPASVEVGRTAADGTFDLGVVPTGSYRVFVESTESEMPSFWSDPLEWTDGEHRRIQLVAPAAGRLRYAIRRSTGEPVDEAVITLVADQPRLRHALEHRAVAERQLVPGNYRLYAMGHGFAWIHGRPFSIRAGETTSLELVVPDAVRTTLRLDGLDELGVSRGSIAVTVRGIGHPHVESFTVPLDAPRPLGCVLPLGRYEVLVGDPQAPRLRGDLEVIALEPSFEPVVVALRQR